jgi:diguanylate cyclase (GGDEF)-like protein
MGSPHPSAGRTLPKGIIGPSAMARTLSYFYLAGGTLVLASLALPDGSGDLAGQAAVALAAYLAGGALYLLPERLPQIAIPGALALGTVLVSALVWFEGDGGSFYGLFYLWVTVESFYLLGRLGAALQVGFMGAAYAGVLALIPDERPVQHWLLVVGVGIVAGALVAYQRGKIDVLVATLDDAARTDPLTGLPNRRAFEELFDSELDRVHRSNGHLSVVLGDLDGFKAVNDRFGHEAGDAALCRVAEDMLKWKRRVDTPARIGGEELALLLPDTDERGAFLVAERLRRATHRSFAEDPMGLTISFGVATYPAHGDDLRSLMRAADRALYAAKDLGKDRTAIYSPEVARVLARASGSQGGDLQLAPLMSLAEALDVRDTGNAVHSRTVGRYARMMAVELGHSPERVERVRVAGVLHDVGKIGVSDPVLVKIGPLGDEDWRELKTHPEIGAQLLSRPELADLRSWVLAHHERPDGAGYPFGLAGDDIPVEARILAVADAYEAMTRGRVYREALGREAAREELRAGAGSQFDRHVVEAFLAALDREREEELDPPAASVTK